MNDIASGQGWEVSRRSVIAGAGAGIVLLCGGGTWRAHHRGVFNPTSGEAFEPWRDWRNDDDAGPLALVSAAILASNAHNAQPWLFQVSASRIEVFADVRRHLGSIDPFHRELHISLGCALENLVLAAQAQGYGPALELTPDESDPTHMATVRLEPGRPGGSALYDAIPDRHTNRHPYVRSRSVPPETIRSLEELNRTDKVKVLWFSSEPQRSLLADHLRGAAEAITRDQEQSFDNGARWMRQDASSIARHRDGLTLDTLGLTGAALIAAKVLPDASLEAADEAWLGLLQGQVESASAFGILAVRDYEDHAQRLEAGRLWQRMHLWMATQGLAAQPMNQLHERADREQQLGLRARAREALTTLVQAPGWEAVFTFRVGYPTTSPAVSPRREVQEVATLA